LGVSRSWFAAVAVATAAVWPTVCRADHPGPLPGHSVHGDTFDEGPRRGAYLMGRTGRVSFPVTTTSKEAQAFINQGVGQLHGFWYLEAERSFRQAAAIDPSCAMAYWGMAMANLTNATRAKGFIAEATKRKYATELTPREHDYIDALQAYHADQPKGGDRKKGFVTALKRIADTYADDIEAKAFTVRYAWEYRTFGDAGYDQAKVDLVLAEIFKAAPDHPAHHFRIHLWDDKNPANAVTAAAECGPSAAGVAHMWHMPGHTYSKLKRYHDAAWQQEASARVDHAYMIRDRVMPYEIHNYAHNNEWLVRDLVFIGRIADAIDLAKNMIELPRHPRYNATSNRGSGGEYGRARLIDVLSQHEMWPTYLDLVSRGYLNDEPDTEQRIRQARYLGVALAAAGDVKGAEKQIAALEALKKIAPTTKPTTAPTNPTTAPTSPTTAPATRPGSVAGNTGGRRGAGNLSLNNGPVAADRGISHIRAQLAIRADDPAKALDLLTKADARKEHLAVANLNAGKKDKAEELARQAVNEAAGQTYPLAVQTFVLHAIGKKDDAKKSFEKLREISEAIDLSVPTYAALEPIAVEFGFGRDWRQLRATPKDLGRRPELQTMGPFRWTPQSAPAWQAASADGTSLSLEQYRGRPVIVVFYLGHTCLHCTQQLHAFAPMTKQFAEEGISIVAVSTDNAAELNKAWEGAKLDGGFPFPLAANPDLAIFKAYNVYDDFEKSPLHGTFLIDANGKIRWRDISHQPFMDTKFLLGEAKRLLAQEGGAPPVRTAGR
jgi:peroxiredoxin/Tfp pilus assembly protein PilF